MLRLIPFLAALLVAGTASATQLFVNAPNDGFLNLRTGPSTRYHVIDRMAHGTEVDVIAAPGKWYKIRHQNGRVGWASSTYLATWSELRDRPGRGGGRHGPDRLPLFYVDAPGYSGLNLREGPGTDHAVLMTMSQGSRVEQLGQRGKWRLLRHESGQIGWAHGGYLSEARAGHKPRNTPRYGHRHDNGRFGNGGHGGFHGQPGRRFGNPGYGGGFDGKPGHGGRFKGKPGHGDNHKGKPDKPGKPRDHAGNGWMGGDGKNRDGLLHKPEQPVDDWARLIIRCQDERGDALARCLASGLVGNR